MRPILCDYELLSRHFHGLPEGLTTRIPLRHTDIAKLPSNNGLILRTGVLECRKTLIISVRWTPDLTPGAMSLRSE